MLTGVELIAMERGDQIIRHGFTPENDLRYEAEELRWAAAYCLTGDIKHWPSGWSHGMRNRIDAKPAMERIAIAGAFAAAELDRLSQTNQTQIP